MGRIIFSTSLTKELFNRLEKERGLVPRSTFIEYLVNKYISEEQDGAVRSTNIPKPED